MLTFILGASLAINLGLLFMLSGMSKQVETLETEVEELQQLLIELSSEDEEEDTFGL